MRQNENTWANAKKMIAIAIVPVGLIFLTVGCSQELQPQLVKRSGQISTTQTSQGVQASQVVQGAPALQAGTRDSSGDEHIVVNVKKSGPALANNRSAAPTSLDSASSSVKNLDTKQVSLLKCDEEAVVSAGTSSTEGQEHCEKVAPVKVKKP